MTAEPQGSAGTTVRGDHSSRDETIDPSGFINWLAKRVDEPGPDPQGVASRAAGVTGNPAAEIIAA